MQVLPQSLIKIYYFFVYYVLALFLGKQEAEDEMQRVSRQQMATQSIIRQLQLKEDDFNEALTAKDSQLAVLRVRLQEVDQELKAKKVLVDELQLQKEQ